MHKYHRGIHRDFVQIDETKIDPPWKLTRIKSFFKIQHLTFSPFYVIMEPRKWS